MHYIVDPHLNGLNGHHFYHFSTLSQYAIQKNIECTFLASNEIKKSSLGCMNIKPYFDSKFKSYIVSNTESMAASRSFESAKEFSNNLSRLITEIESESTILIPNGHFTALIALPRIILHLATTYPTKKIYLRMFLGDLGIHGSPTFADFIYKSIFYDIHKLLKQTCIELRLICTSAHSLHIKKFSPVDFSCIETTTFLPNQNHDICKKILTQKSKDISLRGEPKSLDYFGRPVEIKNNLAQYLNLVRIAQTNGYPGIGKIHFDKSILSSLSGSQKKLLDLYSKKIRLQVIVHEDLDNINWFIALAKLECLVTLSDGSFYTSVIGSSNRVKEALMLGIPVITNSDSIADMNLNNPLEVEDPISIVKYPLSSEEVLNSIKSIGQSSLSVNAARKWQDYCNPEMWARDMFGI